MTGLQNDATGSGALHDGALHDGATEAAEAAADPPESPSPQDRSRGGRHHAENAGLAQLHESIAALLASRGQWRQAYQHVRSALDLLYSGSDDEPPHIPEQLRREVDRLRKEHAEAREQSLRDSLTAAYNRRYLNQRLVALLNEERPQGSGLALALVDLDWFKQVNDAYGHPVGDRVLQRVVELLQEGLPQGAFCARYGGEEFVLVLPAIDSATALAVCEAARERIDRFPWNQIASGLHLTISIGLTYEAETQTSTSTAPAYAETQLLRADGLLYAAKRAGRNAVAHRIGDSVRLAGAAAQRRAIA